MKTTKFSLSGTVEKNDNPTTSGSNGLKLQATYILKDASRDGDVPTHEIDLAGNNVAELQFNDGTTWLCDANTLHDVFPQDPAATRSTKGVVALPTRLGDGSLRSVGSDVALQAVKIFSKDIIHDGVKKIARQLEEKQVGDDIPEGGRLCQLNSDFSLTRFTPAAKDTGPYLVFIHGTNSSTKEAYGGLQSSASLWNLIQKTYGNKVLAFEHRTLTESPLQNAAALAAQLPDDAVLHIITHSRGGLIGDILCRYDSNNEPKKKAFTDAQMKALNDEDRNNDIAFIKKLDHNFSSKKIQIKKFIRVAAPAAGTILASKRLDRLFNIFFNLLKYSIPSFAATEIAGILQSLIAEILKTKDDTAILPGIEAMDPESTFIKVLNDQSQDAAIKDNSLAIISGNSQVGFSLAGLLSIVTKIFFWRRNDMVVNTDSMYLGAKRSNDIQYFFDTGKSVSHTTYFDDERIHEMLEVALNTADGELIPGFRFVQQTEVPKSDRAGILGLEYGNLVSSPPGGKRPIVIILPGIMGSNISSKKPDKQLWINYPNFITGGLMDLKELKTLNITATSAVSTSYKRLYNRLSVTYDVVVFPFDWRQQLNNCAELFNDKVIELLKLNQPIKIIGHSMGGVLVRDFIVRFNATWMQLNASAGFRLLFLGSPLGGSYRIPAVLFGNDAIINTLATVDIFHSKKKLLTMFSNFPGILSLLPLNPKNGKDDFGDIQTWIEMREAFGDSSWPLPSDALLEEFDSYRNNILAQKDKIDYTNMVYIAGKAEATPCGYTNDTIPPRTELAFLYTPEGDSSVTWDSGIPEQMIENKTVYYVNVSHGKLADEPNLFDGIEDILIKGKTAKFSTNRPVLRGSKQVFRAEVPIDFDFSERGVTNAILGLTDTSIPKTESRVPVNVSISQGDLRYASYPVIAGHFLNDGILYAEKSIDNYLGGCLTRRAAVDIYPGQVGTSDIFLSPSGSLSFKGAIIVGLGDPEKLTSFLLAKTVEQGVLNYLLSGVNLQEPIGVSALMIGCGYGGLSIESSVKAIIEGVNEANHKMANLPGLAANTAKRVANIEFVERYEDKALSGLYQLNIIKTSENEQYNINLIKNKITFLLGCKRRLPVESDSSWWNRIGVKGLDANGNLLPGLVFGTATRDAREEENELHTSRTLIDLFIEEISTNDGWDGCQAKTVFELMIPNQTKERLKQKSNIIWVLDKGAAAYPWELLQDSASDAKPLCVSAGMIRQLSTPTYRLDIKRSARPKALIVGDPILDGFINQLQGAQNEAQTVKQMMDAKGFENTAVIGKNAADVLKALFCDDYKILHLAGHGMYSPEKPNQSGMVLGKNVFLTPADIKQMGAVPELVFINCCYLGKVNVADEMYYQSRYKMAANIGTQLIEMGVKAIIVAGWAVHDEAAEEFAKNFYKSMFEGATFGDAVLQARISVYENFSQSNNTWGAYQCYGDPFYKLKNSKSGKADRPYYIPNEAENDLNNFYSDLDSIYADEKIILEEFEKINAKIAAAALKSPGILEKRAFIYAELNKFKEANEIFVELLSMEKAGFSVSALEKYCQVKMRLNILTEDFTEISKTIDQIKELLKISPTAERNNLLGSAYKEQAAMLKGKKRMDALMKSKECYEEAFKKTNDIYPQCNLYGIDTIIKINNKGGKLSAKRYAGISDALKQLDSRKFEDSDETSDMDYWKIIDKANVALCKLIVQQNDKSNDWENVYIAYCEVWKKCGSISKRTEELRHIGTLYSLIDDPKNKLKLRLKALKERLESYGK